LKFIAHPDKLSTKLENSMRKYTIRKAKMM